MGASAVHTLLDQHPLAPTGLHASAAKHPHHHHHLALQVAHNLRYQHLWTNVYLHTRAPDGVSALPRPIISGLPPRRLYVHPDEQIELLQSQKDQGRSGMPDLAREPEWVLPSHLREKWTLRSFGEVFDQIPAVPAITGGRHADLLFGDLNEDAGSSTGDGAGDARNNKWRASLPKRLVLATLDDDSTVVYYIVHDGIVKPRQN